MNSTIVIEKLQQLYPDKSLILSPEERPSEILCEIEPTDDHPEYSVAIAVMGKSAAHYHIFSTETYEVLLGTLTLFINGVPRILEKGEKVTIEPGAIHYATGEHVWVRVTSRPGWDEDDHFLVS